MVKDLDFVASSRQPQAVMDYFVSLPWVRQETNHGTTKSSVLLESGLSAATCLVDRLIDAGAHSILIVTAQSLGVRHGEPLLSFNRDLRRLQPGAGEGG